MTHVVEHVGFAPHYVDYHQAWDRQRAVHAQVVAGEAPDTTLLLEHRAVFTAGKRTAPRERPTAPTLEVIDVDRGGKITWHGPGQLVGYPIWRLDFPIDVLAHVRRLEDLLLAVTARFGVPGTRVAGRSGVWVTHSGQPDRKIAAIGVRVSRGVTMHGFALNCQCDLSWSNEIIACGLDDASVTSMSRELGREVTVAEVLPVLRDELDLLVNREPAVSELEARRTVVAVPCGPPNQREEPR
ncbi:MAG: lipoyl(octanoyl) transferase LipB [Angustibacter sp.]